jgi:hypothetical protein
MINYSENPILKDNYKLSFFIIFFLGHIFLLCGLFNKMLFPLEHDDTIENDKKEEKVVDHEINVVKKEQTPYEEKYLTKVRGMKNEYMFTEEELLIQENKLQELIKEEKNKQLEQIFTLNEKIEHLTSKLLDSDDDNSSGSKGKRKAKEKTNQTNKDESLKRQIYNTIQNEIDVHRKELLEIQNEQIHMDELEQTAKQYIIDEQLKKFKMNYVIEHTPLGNVLMFYNHDKLAFEYYSDLTIPYRYLETVARKYVITYNYRPLYIDMDEEFKEYENKLKKKEEEEKNKYKQENVGNKTKDVFAKFKSYNKEAGTGRVNTAPPPKNNIPQNRRALVNDNKKDANEKILLKENANRYSYQGKFLNFNILQKIDRKVVDKKYALSYADFKKAQYNKMFSSE